MKFFLDTANLEELRKGVAWGIVDGVTTNPTLIAREGSTTAEQINQICEIVIGDVSAEVISTTTEEMLKEGRQLAQMHENVVVKLPLTRDGIKAVYLDEKFKMIVPLEVAKLDELPEPFTPLIRGPK